MTNFIIYFLFLITLTFSVQSQSIFLNEKSLSAFYLTKNGEMIMNPNTYTDDIKKMLQKENEFIMRVLPRYKSLLEIGCGPSSRAQEVVQKDCKYFGIDINSNHIKQSLMMFEFLGIKEMASAKVFSAYDLNNENIPFALDPKTLIYFPFNLMGNLDDFHIIIENLIEMGNDFCFSTYKINQKTMNSRHKYYANCGCNRIRYTKTPVGDLFDSQDGLYSAAFKISYLIEMIENILDQNEIHATVAIHDTDIGNIIYIYNIHR